MPTTSSLKIVLETQFAYDEKFDAEKDTKPVSDTVCAVVPVEDGIQGRPAPPADGTFVATREWIQNRVLSARESCSSGRCELLIEKLKMGNFYRLYCVYVTNEGGKKVDSFLPADPKTALDYKTLSTPFVVDVLRTGSTEFVLVFQKIENLV